MKSQFNTLVMLKTIEYKIIGCDAFKNKKYEIIFFMWHDSLA